MTAPSKDYTFWQLLKDSALSWKAIPVYFTTLSIVSLIQHTLELGLSKVFEFILNEYNELLELAFIPLEWLLAPAVAYLSHLFNIDIDLGESWRHALFIMFMYFVIDLRVGYLRRKSSWAAIISTSLIGIFVGTVFSTLSAMAAAADRKITAALIPAVGFGVYEMIKAPFTASMSPVMNKSWRESFFYFFNWYGVGNLIIGLCAFLIFLISPLSSKDAAEFLILVIVLFLISLRNLVAAFYRAYFITRKIHSNWIHHFLISGSVQVAANLIIALFLGIVSLILNAGLKALSY